MDKGFNDLFNDFLNNRNKPKKNSDTSRLRDEARKMIEMMMGLESAIPLEGMERTLDTNLGDPDEIESGFDGVLYFEKRIWHTPQGDIVKVIVTDDPKRLGGRVEEPKLVEKTLEEQLQEALEKEDYEKAAELRDKMNPAVEKPKKRTRKKE